MTEEEAKTKWCPYVQIAGSDGREGDNRGHGGGSYKCLGSECMAWRWDSMQRTVMLDPDEKPKAHGFCGLSGKP